MSKKKSALVSGASFAGLSIAYWLKHVLGYEVTVVEIAPALKMGGTAVNIEHDTVDVVKRMGIFDAIEANRMHLDRMDFKNADDSTARSLFMRQDGEPLPTDAFEIDRSKLVTILHGKVKDDVEVIFSDSVIALSERPGQLDVTFMSGAQRAFDFVFGCDGIHSAVRRLCFGEESEYLHFLQQYFSITIVDKLLIPQGTAQLFNVPGKAVMLNAYEGKTDVILCFVSEKEIPYDYRSESQQRQIIRDQFVGEGWRTAELLDEVMRSKTFYFDKLCQIRMPSWTKGRVTLVGDAAYCPSPAAGRGGSTAIDGAAALADALHHHGDDFESAFRTYDASFRPIIEGIQAEAVRVGLETLVPRTEEAIRKRNAQEHGGF